MQSVAGCPYILTEYSDEFHESMETKQKLTAAGEGRVMKRMLVLACMLLAGFFIAGCEEEEHEHRYGAYGYRPPYEYREHRGYRDGYYGREYDGRGYRLMDETAQSETVSPAQTTAEP